jgi:CO/xanthine dehydrogenase FAD-binding subunit
MPDMQTYHRPGTLGEALELLAEKGRKAVILAGGTALVPNLDAEVPEVIDLQAVDLTQIEFSGDQAIVGAMVRLNRIAEDEAFPEVIRRAARYEGPNTLRNAATVGGTVVDSDWESELCAAFLAYEATVTVQTAGGQQEVALEAFKIGDYPGGIVIQISLALGGAAALERVARTPADRPIVSVIGRRDAQGQTRLSFCGVADRPVLLTMADLPGLAPPADCRGSTAYRQSVAITLAERVVRALDQ